MSLDDVVAKVADPYERQARLYPALLALLPLLTMVSLLYSSKATGLTSAIAVAVSCGGLYLVTSWCRDLGARLEKGLYLEWGGTPTTQLLRHRDEVIEAVTKLRYHAFLGSKISVVFPGKDEEASDPRAADEIYRSGVRWLLDHTRPYDGKKFDMIFRENVAYGFRRNSLGIKPVGLIVSVGSILWVLAAEKVIFSPGHRLIDFQAFSQMPERAIASLIISGGMVLAWLFFFTKAGARTAAFTFADALLRACDTL